MNQKKAKSVDVPESKAAKFTAFNSVEVIREHASLRLEKRNMLLSTQVALFLQGLLMQRAAEITLKKIICVWCPHVEPGLSAAVKISVSYNLGDETDDMNAEETIISVTGLISETLRVDVFPTKPIIKTADMAFYIPWSVSADIPDAFADCEHAIVGTLKMWCQIGIKTYFSKKKPETRTYKEPLIQWSNLYYPYYIPFYMMKKVRGLHSVLWRDTDLYKKFKAQIGVHLDEKLYPEGRHLAIMQTLSCEDASKISEITANCHINAGGFCTCGDKVGKFVASALANNHGRCNDHGAIYDRIGRDIMTGNIKMISGHPEIKF